MRAATIKMAGRSGLRQGQWIDAHWPARRVWLRWAIVLFVLLRIPEVLVIGFGNPMFQRRVLPAHTQDRVLRLVPAELRPVSPDEAERGTAPRY
jgi:hypothetical protein